MRSEENKNVPYQLVIGNNLRLNRYLLVVVLWISKKIKEDTHLHWNLEMLNKEVYL